MEIGEKAMSSKRILFNTENFSPCIDLDTGEILYYEYNLVHTAIYLNIIPFIIVKGTSYTITYLDDRHPRERQVIKSSTTYSTLDHCITALNGNTFIQVLNKIYPLTDSPHLKNV